MKRESAFVHIWRLTRKPHKARGKSPLRERLMLALQGQSISWGWTPPQWLHTFLLKILYVERTEK